MVSIGGSWYSNGSYTTELILSRYSSPSALVDEGWWSLKPLLEKSRFFQSDEDVLGTTISLSDMTFVGITEWSSFFFWITSVLIGIELVPVLENKSFLITFLVRISGLLFFIHHNNSYNSYKKWRSLISSCISEGSPIRRRLPKKETPIARMTSNHKWVIVCIWFPSLPSKM